MIHVAGGVIYNPNKGIVLVEQFQSSWSLPKGHVEHNESPRDTAIREIWEETGLSEEQLTCIAPLGFYERMKIKEKESDPDELRTITMYLFTTKETTLTPHDIDISEAIWLPVHEVAKKLTHEKDREYFTRITPTILKYVTGERTT